MLDGSTAFLLALATDNKDLVTLLFNKSKPSNHDIEKAIVLSCFNGHPIHINFLLKKLPYLTNDQKELLDSCVKGDIDTVLVKTLGNPDSPLILGLTPLMVASSCGHVNIVDALMQAGADVHKQSPIGFTPLFFAVAG